MQVKINKSHERSCKLVRIRIKITRMFLFCSNCAYDSNPYDSVQNRLSESQKKLSEQLNYNASFKVQEENNFNNLFFTSLARYKKVRVIIGISTLFLSLHVCYSQDHSTLHN